MSDILEQMLRSKQFIPTTVQEYIALQLAKGLRDEVAIQQYVRYLGRYTIGHLIHLFHKVQSDQNPALKFHSSLNATDT
jgi:hypothetical protein